MCWEKNIILRYDSCVVVFTDPCPPGSSVRMDLSKEGETIGNFVISLNNCQDSLSKSPVRSTGQLRGETVCNRINMKQSNQCISSANHPMKSKPRSQKKKSSKMKIYENQLLLCWPCLDVRGNNKSLFLELVEVWYLAAGTLAELVGAKD